VTDSLFCLRSLLAFIDFSIRYDTIGEPSDAVEIKSLEVDPDPPKPGHKLTIYASGTVKETIDVRQCSFCLVLFLLSLPTFLLLSRHFVIPSPALISYKNVSDLWSLFSRVRQEGAYADVVVKLGLVKILTRRFDICEELYVTLTLFSFFYPARKERLIFVFGLLHLSVRKPMQPYNAR
jgi:hypothetical protein